MVLSIGLRVHTCVERSDVRSFCWTGRRIFIRLPISCPDLKFYGTFLIIMRYLKNGY
jgi:hypothetical protein